MNTNEILTVRQTLADNIEYLLDTVSSYKQEVKNNSFDLFSDDDQVSDKIELKPITAIHELNVLLKEKEFLGLYVTKNPIMEFSALREHIREVSEHDNIHLILIDKIKKIFTRNKDMMFALEISIDGDKVEGIIFPKNAMALSPLLEEKTLYWIMGKISTPKKRKQEVVIQEEGEFESEDGNQVQEFVELPKLIIENLTPFVQGPSALFNSEENRISKKREEILAAIDYTKILSDPSNFHSHKLELEPNGPQKARIEIPNTMNQSQALQIKKLLSTGGTKDYDIELYVQLPTGEFKRAKNEFHISTMVFDQIQELLK
jgi:hypothetical protein